MACSAEALGRRPAFAKRLRRDILRRLRARRMVVQVVAREPVSDAISLLTGKISGYFRFFGVFYLNKAIESPVPQRFLKNSLLKLSGKLFRITGIKFSISGYLVAHNRATSSGIIISAASKLETDCGQELINYPDTFLWYD
jgi:hypothetical protein